MKAILVLVGALAAAGCVPLEVAGRVVMIAGQASKKERPDRPTSDVEVVRCRVASGAEVITAPRNCVEPAG
ncbi:hypothetical protein ABMY26_07180 (plasmid) [Azospirillum sp. HJ39]|uniref:hypothetical protein n=1 Tax=Azospirillum sp. HJ39 TaxID=3159496 RepID=UPI0035588617